MTSKLKNQKPQKLEAILKPSGFLDYKKFLSHEFLAQQKERGTYSYRQFSEDLGFSFTTYIQQIATNKRALTEKAALKIAQALKITGSEKKYLLLLVDYVNSKRTEVRDQAFDNMLKIRQKELPRELDKKHMEYFRDWFHPVVRELVGQKNFKEDPNWIAKQLIPNIRPEQAKKSLQLLQDLGMVKFDEKSKKWEQCEERVDTGAKVAGIGLVNYHYKMIDLGKESLNRTPAKDRDISALTMNLSEEKFKKLKELIHNFQLEVLEEAEQSKGDTKTYQMNIQFFPIAGSSK